MNKFKIDPEKQELIRTIALVVIAASLFVIAYNINTYLEDIVDLLGALVNKGN
ncbi:hypothetical protein ACSS6N_09510 [Peribacillus frigoritolerans]|jgi:hypothetical protein|uniref:hypothetical protein n=1 Tax=Peribacillus frigoritolerans TaxID=450367 RepID=UPI003F840DC6